MTMRTLKQRILITLAATVLVAACGTLAGWMLGRFITLRLAERRLWQEATRATTEEDVRLTELRSVLAAMTVSTYPPCSSAELTYFRALIFNAKYLKDAGRMIDGKIDCSASLARPEQPLAQAKPDFTLSGEIGVYKNLALYQSEDPAMLTLQYDGFYVVRIPFIQSQSIPGSGHFTEIV
ncbi:MAG: CSS-motif domain-containing protein, partial [Terracidiphilus sp.]